MNWLNKIRDSLHPKAVPALALGAFGKHPGWNDHLEDLGLDTEALLAARQLLYVQGIGGAIDSGDWNNAGAASATPPEPGELSDAVPDFGHLFFWFSRPDFLAGRLWASCDGKGRDRYPMVVCAHAAHLEPDITAARIVAALESLREACRATETARR